MDGAIILGSHGQRLARANVHLVPDPIGADQRDRHPPPHRRACGPLDPGAGRQRQRGDGRHHCLRRRDEAPAARHRPPASIAPTRRCKRWSATRCASTTRWPTSPRWSWRAWHRPRRRRGRAARRDGAAHLRRDRDDDRRARRRRPPAAPAGRRGVRRDQARAGAGARRLPDDRQQLGRHGPHGDSPASPRGLRLLTRVPHASPDARRWRSSTTSATWPSCSEPPPPRSPQSTASTRSSPLRSRRPSTASPRRASSTSMREPARCSAVSGRPFALTRARSQGSTCGLPAVDGRPTPSSTSLMRCDEHAAPRGLVQLLANVGVQHVDHSPRSRMTADRTALEHLRLALQAMVEVRLEERLRVGDRGAVGRPQRRVVAAHHLAQRVDVGAHVAVGRRHDRRAPPHHVVAGEQRLLLVEGVAHVVRRVARACARRASSTRRPSPRPRRRRRARRGRSRCRSSPPASTPASAASSRRRRAPARRTRRRRRRADRRRPSAHRWSRAARRPAASDRSGSG